MPGPPDAPPTGAGSDGELTLTRTPAGTDTTRERDAGDGSRTHTGADGVAAPDPLARLSQLVAVWQEGNRRGEPPAVEDLCPDDPLVRELLRRAVGASPDPQATRPVWPD